MRLAPTLLLVTLAACSEAGNQLTTAPEQPEVHASSSVVATANGSALQVRATVRNTTSKRIEVAIAPQCPLALRLLPDSAGTHPTETAATDACPLTGTLLSIAPGDSATLVRTVPADDSLLARSAGDYSLSVSVTTRHWLTGTFGGVVHLPLPATP